MSTGPVYDAFAQLVAAFAAGEGLPCSYPGVDFVPPTAGLWLELQWFPNDTQNYGTSDDGPALLQGFAQLSACDRPGRGLAPGAALADRIIAAFGKGTTFARVRVYRMPWVNSVIPDPERIMQPVTIPYRGFANSP